MESLFAVAGAMGPLRPADAFLRFAVPVGRYTLRARYAKGRTGEFSSYGALAQRYTSAKGRTHGCDNASGMDG
ncbi:MAG: hypothetical protein OHK0012_06380 [Synechococcales cyanobacterium]